MGHNGLCMKCRALWKRICLPRRMFFESNNLPETLVSPIFSYTLLATVFIIYLKNPVNRSIKVPSDASTHIYSKTVKQVKISPFVMSICRPIFSFVIVVKSPIARGMASIRNGNNGIIANDVTPANAVKIWVAISNFLVLS